MGRTSELEHQVDKLNKEKRDYVEEIKVSFIKSVIMAITQEFFFFSYSISHSKSSRWYQNYYYGKLLMITTVTFRNWNVLWNPSTKTSCIHYSRKYDMCDLTCSLWEWLNGGRNYCVMIVSWLLHHYCDYRFGRLSPHDQCKIFAGVLTVFFEVTSI